MNNPQRDDEESEGVMSVAEMIEWLKTQDQDREVEVLAREVSKFSSSSCYDMVDWNRFDSDLHASTFYSGVLQIGRND